MGFKDAKRQIIECINSGLIVHEQRNNIDVKNLLAVGQITLCQVAGLINRSRGDSYSTSPHHFDSSIDVHIIKTKWSDQVWYIK